ncbi:ATP-NAD kinase [Halosimplex carlsbadense 2-9-1]|uniref:ATP-NAD kinase n=1 Tax=Halosimplex carlsbadense 2-9-1 TaxID=797114 RepID=M0CRA0_9EURY|nr:NAD(+)/NADH kinase [Halosimplex carlsbadense]ELZ25790.1 ATP-NAD kinase [Halosimplex carlsbadense 2-9-1]
MSDSPVVGVVGADADAVVAAVESAGARATAGTAKRVVEDSDAVVAVGEPALLAVARTGTDAPVLPVAAGPGVRSLPREEVATGVADFVAGDYERVPYPLVDVHVADRTRATALFDLMLVSAEPAQISEYAVERGDDRVARFRADGVVVATPAGSSGYASAAGGPVLTPDTDAVAVVPVAPFETDIDHWVLPPAGLSVSVERDETTVHLLADDRVVGPVEPHEAVHVAPAGSVSLALVAAGRSPFPPA